MSISLSVLCYYCRDYYFRYSVTGTLEGLRNSIISKGLFTSHLSDNRICCSIRHASWYCGTYTQTTFLFWSATSVLPVLLYVSWVHFSPRR